MAKDNMILIMVDECGEETELERFRLGLDLDEDELDIWKTRKLDRAREAFPEARGFFFEDRRGWDAEIAHMIAEDFGGGRWDDEDEDNFNEVEMF